MNRMAKTLFAATVLLLGLIAPAAAEVVRLEITGKTPYGTFRPGEYVLWRGKVHGELAPGEAIRTSTRPSATRPARLNIPPRSCC